MKRSAGILVYKWSKGQLVVLLTHPGGPIWGKRERWSIPKGELGESEELLSAAAREFREELGFEPPDGDYLDLGFIKQDSTKTNYVWAVEGDVDLSQFQCATFKMEWPPRSGRVQEFPENDRADWFELAVARTKVFKAQVGFLERLADKLSVSLPTEPDQQSLL